MRFQINPIFLKLLLLIKCSFKILFSFFIILMAQYSIKNKGVGNRKLRFLQVALPASDTALAFYWRKSGPWNCFCIGDTESPGRGNEQTEESRHGRPWVPCWKALVFSFLNVESNLTPWNPTPVLSRSGWVGMCRGWGCQMQDYSGGKTDLREGVWSYSWEHYLAM